ncbi:MAG: Mur ligase family protein [Microbacteriaceae bacterium]
MLRYLPALLIGRLARFLIRIVRKGGGSALPGLILSKLAPGILPATLDRFPDGLLIVTGSAGKSTTTKMLVGIARAHGKSVFTNPSTANILQGFYSTIIEKASLRSGITADVAILEMDEGHADVLSAKFAPRQVTVMNVMEDQLDRFVDPALVREALARVASRATKTVILNADDQNTIIIGEVTDAPKRWFGINEDLIAGTRHGLATAATYLPSRSRPVVDVEATAIQSTTVSFDSKGYGAGTFTLPNRGLHFVLDAVAALESAYAYLGDSFDSRLAAKTLNELPPVFARGELTEVNGEPVEFILVQNPGSMQLNLDNLKPGLEQIMFAIGRDVHDPSWLWTVDYSNLPHANVVTGYNAYEAALLLEYHDKTIDLVTDDLGEALDTFFALPKPKSGVKTVIFSADAMRRMRRALGFWSPEEVER